MRTCVNCGKELGDKVSTCPNCGRQSNFSAATLLGAAVLGFLIAACAFLILGFVGISILALASNERVHAVTENVLVLLLLALPLTLIALSIASLRKRRRLEALIVLSAAIWFLWPATACSLSVLSRSAHAIR